MARFSISMSVEFEAADYDEAFDIQDSLFKDIARRARLVELRGPYEIDVEQTSALEEEEE
jgi:hypothetical protein